MRLVKEKQFWILLILSCATRSYVWCTTPIIGRDGVDFINIAKVFSSGNLTRGLEHPFHPLYPMLTSLGLICGMGAESSGRAVSFLLSVSTVIVLYVIGKRMFNPAIAFTGALLLALHPYAVRLSVDVMSDPTYFFFYVAGFGLGYVAINRRTPYLFFLTGSASALAYLTRPEGISVFLMTGLWVCLQRAGESLWKRDTTGNAPAGNRPEGYPINADIKHIGLLMAGFFIFALPYIIYLRGETGHWELSKKKRLSQVTSLDAVLKNTDNNESQIPPHKSSTPQTGILTNNLPQAPATGGGGSAPDTTLLQYYKDRLETRYHVMLYKLVSQYMDSLHYPLLLFLIIGIYCTIIDRPLYRRQNRYIISYTILFVFILFSMQRSIGYASYRHLMNIALVTLFWAATGVNASAGWIDRRFFQTNDTTRNPQSATRGYIIIFCIIAAMTLPKALKTRRGDKAIRKEAGLWLKQHHPGTMTLVTDRLIISLYADTNGLELPKNIYEYDDILYFARSNGADYLAVTENIEEKSPEFFRMAAGDDMEKIKEFTRNGKKVVIFEIDNRVHDDILDKWE